jgi:CheY-like chemotaxis protein
MNESCLILLVEDDEDDVFFLRRALEKLGFEGKIEHFLDIEAAKSFVTHTNGPMPSLVIADSAMSCRGSGVDLLEWIRKHDKTKTVPFVILSGDIQPHMVSRAEVAGANLILTKRSDFDDMTAQVRQGLLQLPARCREWLK